MTDEEKKALDKALADCECPPLRLTTLQQHIREQAEKAGIPQSFMEASDHAYFCRCEKCREWWVRMGPDEEGSFGPFTREEIRG